MHIKNVTILNTIFKNITVAPMQSFANGDAHSHEHSLHAYLEKCLDFSSCKEFVQSL